MALAEAENRDAAICWPLGSAPSHLLRRHHTGGTRHPPVGATPHCIDFILTVGDIKAEATEVLFTGRQAMRGGVGYVSDHVGLLARLNCPGT